MEHEFPDRRTAIVTGGARRIGAAMSRALGKDGWSVLIHCNRSVAEAEQLAHEIGRGARVVSADLARSDCAERIGAALEGMPPPALLINNASRFEYDAFGDFGIEGWTTHIDINFRAPALITRMFAGAIPAGGNGLVVNMLDAKLVQPNPDFFTYTLSKMGLAGLTELSARALAGRGIRVCGIAPAVTLVSGPQSRSNFEKVHTLNPLHRGVDVDDIIRALRWIISTPTITGQTITIDGGQRFLGLARDVQFLEER